MGFGGSRTSHCIVHSRAADVRSARTPYAWPAVLPLRSAAADMGGQPEMRVFPKCAPGLLVGVLSLAVALAGGLDAVHAEPDVAPAQRSVLDAARILGQALATGTWDAYEATLTTAEDVRRLEAAFVAAGDDESVKEQLLGLRLFVERHGGYEGAAKRQRADALAKCRAELERARAQVGDVELQWGRHLPARTWLVADTAVRAQEEAFSLRAGDREVVFGGVALQLEGGWSFSAGVSFQEVMGKTVEKPDAASHPLAGPWSGLEMDARGGLRDVTLWLAPQEQADRYVLHVLSTLGSIQGMSAASTHVTGMTQQGEWLRGSGFDLRVLAEGLRGKRDGRAFEVRRMPLEAPVATTPLDKPIEMNLRGMAAVFVGRFADTKRVSYELTVRGAKAVGAIDVRLRPVAGTMSEVGSYLEQDATVRLAEHRLVAAGPDGPWFEWYMQNESAFFRLLPTSSGQFGPPPAIVHGYSHFK